MFTTSDDEAQLRAVARSIKQRLADDRRLRPSDFAIVFRRVGPHLAAARRIFHEYALPLDPAAGERLAERPFGVWALHLLRLGVHGWRLLDVLDACVSGFFDAAATGLEARDFGRLRRTGRKGQFWAGLPALEQLGDALRAEDERSDAGPSTAPGAWTTLLGRLAPDLDPAAMRTPGRHAATADALLFGPDGLVRADAEAAIEAGALRAELARIRATEEALGGDAVSFATFLDTLETRMQRPSTLIREAGGVLLAPMHTLHGLRFAHVALAGLSEGEFPAPARSGVLLGAEGRAHLEAHATEDELWRTAVSRAATTTTYWRPRLDAGGRPAAASYYFSLAGAATELPAAIAPEGAASRRELAVALTSRWPTESRRPDSMPAWDTVVRAAAPTEQARRSFASAGAYEGQLPGIDVAQLVGPETVWSATRIEAYRTCSFQFFARYALRLSELDEELPQADAATRGLVMHAMLDDALADLVAQQRPFDATGLEGAKQRLRIEGRTIWNAAPVKWSFGRAALWRYETDLAIKQLESLLDRESAMSMSLGMTAVIGGERKFEQRLPGIEPPLLLQANVDRIDASDDAILVVDYKTGRVISWADVEAGRRLQLQLYAIVAAAELGKPRQFSRYAFLRPPAKDWNLDSARDPAILDTAAEVAAEVRTAVTHGDFAVAPEVTDCPTYCAARTLCRVNHFSRAKTWS